MVECWTPMVERIVFATFKRGNRILAVTSPRPAAGVTSLCEQIARVTALTGSRTLLVDMTRQAEGTVPESVWQPCKGNAGQSIVHDPQGFDRLTARFTPNERFAFGNTDRLRQSFAEDLASYEAVVVDARPVPTLETAYINGAAAAAACDATIVLCMAGRVARSELAECQDALANAQVNLLGVVLNEMQSPTLGAELAREARRLHKVLPRFSKWLERKAMANAFLN
ncbi:MAG: hypothetical protein ABL901_09300 [Hyphomicrobiaceae bacterium]